MRTSVWSSIAVIIKLLGIATMNYTVAVDSVYSNVAITACS